MIGLALVWWGFSACSGDPLDAKLDVVEITSSGRPRTAFVHFPRAPGDPPPLVVALHGGGSSGPRKGRKMARNWTEHFDRGIALAFPNGLYEAARPEGADDRPRAWFSVDDPPELQGVDLVFLRELIDAIDRLHPIDRHRVFLTGFSAGGAFAWYAACVDPEPYAGFGVVGMTIPERVREGCAPALKRPLIYVHGEEDERVPLAGTERASSWDDTVQWLLESRACARYPMARPVVTGDDPTQSDRARGAAHLCRNVRSLEVWRVRGAGHCWPGGEACGDIDAGALLIDYWRRAAGFP